MNRMTFVDGENLTIRGQKVLEKADVKIQECPLYKRDCFIWIPTYPALDWPGARAARAYYYTSHKGNPDAIREIEEQLWNLKFSHQVFKKNRQGEKAKGVDIALTKDMLVHAFLNHYSHAFLFAGDGDYVPLVEEVKRLGKRVMIYFFKDEGLSPELRLAADGFSDITGRFVQQWIAHLQR